MANETLSVVLGEEVRAAFADFLAREKGRFDSRSAAGAHLVRLGLEAEASGRTEAMVLRRVKEEIAEVVGLRVGESTGEILGALGYDPSRPAETVIAATKKQGSRVSGLAVHAGKHAMVAALVLRWALLYLTDNEEELVGGYMRGARADADEFYRTLVDRASSSTNGPARESGRSPAAGGGTPRTATRPGAERDVA